jgi:hypothetical protein
VGVGVGVGAEGVGAGVGVGAGAGGVGTGVGVGAGAGGVGAGVGVGAGAGGVGTGVGVGVGVGVGGITPQAAEEANSIVIFGATPVVPPDTFITVKLFELIVALQVIIICVARGPGGAHKLQLEPFV